MEECEPAMLTAYREAWDDIFWRGAKVKISTYIGDGTNLNQKILSKAKAPQSVWKEE